ncbi:MAG: diphthine--ammonia ligase [Flavobacteriales bacterium]|nr:diphthine--ammonia ligase [Flavobacteriales bacterium]
MKPKALFNWSGGKDSSFCLHRLLQSEEFEITTLLTSVNAHFNRISMHGVRVDLLEQQAASLGLPLQKLELPETPTMKEYEEIMTKELNVIKATGVTHSIFGDIFLEDLKVYREKQLKNIGLQAVFPLWKIPTDQLIREFLDLGFKAVIVCHNSKYMDESFSGRLIDHQFLKDLPDGVDPCGENGEFHSFVYDGPIFKEPIKFEIGEKVYKEYDQPKPTKDEKADKDSYHCNTDSEVKYGFWFCDLIGV